MSASVNPTAVVRLLAFELTRRHPIVSRRLMEWLFSRAGAATERAAEYQAAAEILREQQPRSPPEQWD